MNINYEYYKVFFYAAKYKSFTKAANVLFQNQPNITRIINKLEDAFGCKLFVRTHKGVNLTPEGEQLFSKVEIAHRLLQKAESELVNQTSLEFGSITIAANETALMTLLLDSLRSFRQKYPNIRINISDQSTPQSIDSLERSSVDFAVVTTPADLHKNMRQTKLRTTDHILVCGPSFKHLSLRRHHISALTEYPLIMLERHTMTYAFFNRFYKDHGLTMRVDTEANTINQALPMVKYDLGLAFLPESFARNALEAGEVFHIPIYEKIPSRDIVLIEDTRKPHSTASKAYIEELKSYAADFLPKKV